MQISNEFANRKIYEVEECTLHFKKIIGQRTLQSQFYPVTRAIISGPKRVGDAAPLSTTFAAKITYCCQRALENQRDLLFPLNRKCLCT